MRFSEATTCGEFRRNSRSCLPRSHERILCRSKMHISLADLNRRALVTADFLRTHPARAYVSGRMVSSCFVEEVIPAQEAIDLVQLRRWECYASRGVCRNGVRPCLMPIRDLKPTELVLTWRSNCSSQAEGYCHCDCRLCSRRRIAEQARNLWRQWTPNLSRNSVGFPLEA